MMLIEIGIHIIECNPGDIVLVDFVPVFRTTKVVVTFVADT